MRAESMVRDLSTARPAPHRFSFQVRAANSLLSITHSLKLLLLLSDEAQIARWRDEEIKQVLEEKNKAQQEVAALLDELFRQRPGSA